MNIRQTLLKTANEYTEGDTLIVLHKKKDEEGFQHVYSDNGYISIALLDIAKHQMLEDHIIDSENNIE